MSQCPERFTQLCLAAAPSAEVGEPPDDLVEHFARAWQRGLIRLFENAVDQTFELTHRDGTATASRGADAYDGFQRIMEVLRTRGFGHIMCVTLVLPGRFPARLLLDDVNGVNGIDGYEKKESAANTKTITIRTHATANNSSSTRLIGWLLFGGHLRVQPDTCSR